MWTLARPQAQSLKQRRLTLRLMQGHRGPRATRSSSRTSRAASTWCRRMPTWSRARPRRRRRCCNCYVRPGVEAAAKGVPDGTRCRVVFYSGSGWSPLLDLLEQSKGPTTVVAGAEHKRLQVHSRQMHRHLKQEGWGLVMASATAAAPLGPDPQQANQASVGVMVA
eukprot:4408339-Lingulodinium_polyedra.AAC.1